MLRQLYVLYVVRVLLGTCGTCAVKFGLLQWTSFHPDQPTAVRLLCNSTINTLCSSTWPRYSSSTTLSMAICPRVHNNNIKTVSHQVHVPVPSWHVYFLATLYVCLM